MSLHSRVYQVLTYNDRLRIVKIFFKICGLQHEILT